jgi:hypothetical protein
MISPDNIVLVLAHGMGMYVAASVLMMRMSVPPAYRVVLSQVLENVEFVYYQRWFDNIFLASSLGSVVVIWVQRKWAGDDDPFDKMVLPKSQ